MQLENVIASRERMTGSKLMTRSKLLNNGMTVSWDDSTGFCLLDYEVMELKQA